MKVKKKINWLVVISLVLFIASLAVIIHDFYMLTIYSFIHSITVSLTWFGLGALVIAFMVAGCTYDYLEERITRATKKERA